MKLSGAIYFFMILQFSAPAHASQSQLPPELQEHVALHYHRDNPAPKHMLFESYVQIVYSKSQISEFDTMDFVVDTLKFEHTPEDEVRALEVAAVFLDAFDKISDQNLAEKYQILCSVDPQERTGKEIVRALNTMDAVGMMASKKYYRIAISLLRTNERRRLSQYLDELGGSYFYISFDHRFLLEPSASTPQERLSTVCDDLANAETYIN